ncbi:MAG: UDP-3-O-acyl-N-acetylglucosamine deacetylase [Planctomycetaceae bacterium]|nr:UDP-3-O-acyl-N-acetylglucosamine deacetylase [Planctomycetaceae bacterium]
MITSYRKQRSLSRPVETRGVGFLTGADVVIKFLPANDNHGIAFQRMDLAGTAPVPARLEYTVPRERRTAISHQGATIEMTEHVMAALAGLQIDNCLVQINAPEPPGGDGSSQLFVDSLLKADAVEQSAPRPCLTVGRPLHVAAEDALSEVSCRPLSYRSLAIGYHLDYGSRSPIRPQSLVVQITPETFLAEICFARTFILESEAAALKAQGYGKRTTAKDLLIFGPKGPIDNTLRASDECVRHKILDCLGDFALIGCDLHGYFDAFRSGHRLNRDLVKKLQLTHAATEGISTRAGAVA